MSRLTLPLHTIHRIAALLGSADSLNGSGAYLSHSSVANSVACASGVDCGSIAAGSPRLGVVQSSILISTLFLHLLNLSTGIIYSTAIMACVQQSEFLILKHLASWHLPVPLPLLQMRRSSPGGFGFICTGSVLAGPSMCLFWLR